MKRLLLAALLLALVGGLWAVEDNFTITVSVEYLEINLRTADDSGDYGVWDIGGPVAAGSQHTMTIGSGGDHVLVDNNCNTVMDFSAYSSDATTWAPGLAAGDEVYLLEGGKGDVGAEPGAYTTFDDASSPGDVYAAGEPAFTNHHFYARLTVPTIVADGNTHTITVAIVAE